MSITSGSTDAPGPSATQAGWRVSRYNIAARIPNDPQGRIAIANLSRGNCGACHPLELAALTMLDELPKEHPAVERLARRGFIVNYDERAALEAQARMACAHRGAVNLTICPTMDCNFDCPYCFESHGGKPMTAEVQENVVGFAARMMDAAHAKTLRVVWFGGEPLLAPHVIESLSERLIGEVEQRGATYYAEVITNGYLLTKKMANLLERVRVRQVQVTIDGVGAAHDATRHLVGGGSTFDRIAKNLSRPGLPFYVSVRHNVHGGNVGEADGVRAFVERLAAESGNVIAFYPALVKDNVVAGQRGQQVGIVDEARGADVVLGNLLHNTGVHVIHCGAGNLFDLGVDATGNLYKCWEAVDKPGLAFGHVCDWDPDDPLATASAPNNLTCFLNYAHPLGDEECAECLWLPICAGGCPYERLFEGRRTCVAWKDRPEDYVLALWRTKEQIARKRAERE